MRYKVLLFRNGDFRMEDEIEAKSYRQASWNLLYGESGHVIVVGKKTKRYNGKGLIKNVKPLFHRFQKGTKYAIMVMNGNVSETYYTKEKSLWEKTWKNLALESAKSVSPDELQKNITACLEEIRGTKSTSTSSKTLKMYVNPAMPQANSMDILTKENFMSEDVKNLAKSGWNPGFHPYRSKLVKVLVKSLPIRNDIPGITRKMYNMQGKVFDAYKFYDMYHVLGWSFKRRWLDFDVVEATVSLTGKQEMLYQGHLASIAKTMKKYEGQSLVFKKSEEPDWYMAKGFYWHKDWLDFNTIEATVDLKGKKREISDKDHSDKIAPAMKEFQGFKLIFKKSSMPNWYYAKGYYWHKDWLVTESS